MNEWTAGITRIIIEHMKNAVRHLQIAENTHRESGTRYRDA